MAASVVRRLRFDRLDSTNAEALRLASDGERGPIWIDADEQTMGRGRSGRHWHSGAGNMMSSYLFATSTSGAALAQLSLVAGVAVFEATSQLAPTSAQQLRLKWPNDLLLENAKVGGILIESSDFGGQRVAVIGVGLNIARAPKIEGVKTANLQEIHECEKGLDRIRKTLATTLASWLAIWDEGQGFSIVRAAWLDKGPRIGDALAIKVGDDIHRGMFNGLDEHGALCLLQTTGEKQCYTFGDVLISDNN